MKGTDVIEQLWKRLPRQSTNFTTNVNIVSISVAGLVATVTTATAHGLLINNLANVIGVSEPVEIDTVTDNAPTSNTFTITTLTDHDLTKNQREVGIVVDARITGGAIDETFTVLAVTNRRSFTVTKGTATPAQGDFLQQLFISGFNGLKQVVSVPTTTTFTYALTATLADPNLVEGSISGKHRISGAVNFEIAKAAYTRQDDNEYWLFVVIEDTSPNKDRKGTEDSSATRGTKQAFYQVVIEGFSLYLFIPNKGVTAQTAGGLIARDKAIDERAAVLSSILGIQFNPGLENPGQKVVTYDGDGAAESDFGGAVYVHRFLFQQVTAITNQDTAVESDDRAFRDINFDITGLGIGDSAVSISADVDLDDTPIT